MFEKIKRFYNLGLYTNIQVKQFAEKGLISSEQYTEITGDQHEE